VGEPDRGQLAIGRLRQALVDAAHDLGVLEGALVEARLARDEAQAEVRRLTCEAAVIELVEARRRD
jgi:hypothetical protein